MGTEPKNQIIDELSVPDIVRKEEVLKLRKKVDVAINEIEASVVYTNVKRQLQNCAELRRHMVRILNSSSNFSSFQMVVYGLGSLELCRVAKYQLAIMLLLRRDFPNLIESRIQLFDPYFYDTDVSVLNELGCEVLSADEECSRKSERPTLFFMPCIPINLTGFLLGSNWCPRLMNQTIILTNSLSDLVGIRLKHYNIFKTNWKYRNDGPSGTKEYNKELQEYKGRMRLIKAYGEAIEPFMKEVRIKRLPEEDKHHRLMYDYAWHFFKVDPQVDMMALLRGKLAKEFALAFLEPFEPVPCNSQEYRDPKLIFTREETSLYYNGSLNEEDDDCD